MLAAAARHGVEIVRVVETHTHADHLSGHGRLALELGIPISIHPAAEAEYAHDALTDGLELELGQVVLRAVHTPGHRPEHTCLTVTDRSRADEPWLVLTGDSLFVGDTARPDLAVGAKEGAEGLFHSLRRLLELPDGVEVFPGHVAGSLCGKAMSSKASSTIGFERRFNHALQIDDEIAFVAEAASVAAPKPPNMARLVELNRGPLVGAPRAGGRAPGRSGRRDGARRPPRVRLRRGPHRAARSTCPSRARRSRRRPASCSTPTTSIVVQAATGDEAERAIRGLQAVGFLDLQGYVLGDGPERIEPVELDDLDALLRDGAELIDVRERDERDNGYIAGSRNIPYRLLPLSRRRGADRPARRDDLRERRARRDRRLDPRRAGHRRPSGARGRPHCLGRPRRPDGRVPPLRRVRAKWLRATKSAFVAFCGTPR